MELITGHDASDAASFAAGYTAASDTNLVRDAMSIHGATSSSFCDRLVAHALQNLPSGVVIVRADYLGGCRRAVSDAME
jgi:hypothetical protein